MSRKQTSLISYKVVHERDLRGTFEMTPELIAGLERYFRRTGRPGNAVHNPDQAEAKTTAVHKKYSQVIGFDRFAGSHGAYFLRAHDVPLSVILDHISDGRTDEEISGSLGLGDPGLVATARAFIHELL